MYLATWTSAFRDVDGVFRVDGPSVKLSAGRIQGVSSVFPEEKKTLDMFLSIPYAKPPVGDLRFEPPQDLDPWTGIKETKESPMACSQSPYSFESIEVAGVFESSEDCLYLNVFLPGKLGEYTKAPVMVWVHGGGFTGGSSNEEYLDARYFTKETKTIVVTINYRLGAFGFLKSEQVAGNMGLLDQVKALQWVRKNIRKFGGNPNEITLSGQSAGAASVALHLLSDMSKNLFHKGILQSGSYDLPATFVEKYEALRRGKLLARRLGCYWTYDVLSCLKNKSVDEILEQQNLHSQVLPYWFVPTIDGHFLTEHPLTILANDTKPLPKPLIMGFNREESSYFLRELFGSYLEQSTLTNKVYRLELFKAYTLAAYYPTFVFPHKIFEIFSKYPPFGNTIINFFSAVKLTTDSGFICPIKNFLSEYSKKNPNVYSYLLTQSFSHPPELKLLKSFHSIDLFYVFGYVIKYKELKNYTEAQGNLSLKMMHSWSSFAKTS